MNDIAVSSGILWVDLLCIFLALLWAMLLGSWLERHQLSVVAWLDGLVLRPDDGRLRSGDRILCCGCGQVRRWGSSCVYCGHVTEPEK